MGQFWWDKPPQYDEKQGKQFLWELVYFFCLILFLLLLKELSVSYDVIFIIFLFMYGV